MQKWVYWQNLSAVFRVPHSFIPLYPVIFACIVYSVNFVNFVCQSVHAVVSTRFDTFSHTLTRSLYTIYSESILKLYTFQKKKKKNTFYRTFCFPFFSFFNARPTISVSVLCISFLFLRLCVKIIYKKENFKWEKFFQFTHWKIIKRTLYYIFYMRKNYSS